MSLTCLSHVSHLSRTWRPQKMRISVGHTGHHSDSTATTTTRFLQMLRVSMLLPWPFFSPPQRHSSTRHWPFALKQPDLHRGRFHRLCFSKTGARLFFSPVVWPSFLSFRSDARGLTIIHQHTCENTNILARTPVDCTEARTSTDPQIHRSRSTGPPPPT